MSYPEPPDADDLRGCRSRFGDVPRDVLPFAIDPFRDFPLDGEGLRDLPLDGEGLCDRTGDEDRDACREDGLDLES